MFFRFVVLFNKFFYLVKMFCTFIYFGTAEFELYKRIFAVPQMKNAIRFKPIAVSVIRNAPTQRI